MLEIEVCNRSKERQIVNLFSRSNDVNGNIKISAKGIKYKDVMDSICQKAVLFKSMSVCSKYRMDNSRACLDITRFNAIGSSSTRKIFFMSAFDIYQSSLCIVEIPCNIIMDTYTTINTTILPSDTLIFDFNEANMLGATVGGFDISNLKSPTDRLKEIEAEAMDRLEWVPLWIENKSSKTKRFMLPTKYRDFVTSCKNNEMLDFYIYDERIGFDAILHTFENQRRIEVSRMYSDNLKQFDQITYTHIGNQTIISTNRWNGYNSAMQITPNIQDYPVDMHLLKQVQCRNIITKRIEFDILPGTNLCLFFRMLPLKID